MSAFIVDILPFGFVLLFPAFDARHPSSLLHVDTAMAPDRLISAGLRWPAGRYSTNEEKIALGRDMIKRMSAFPE